MKAIIKTGGKQYIVEPGKTYTFEKIPGEAGSMVTFEDVLLTFDENGKDVQVGTPIVSGVTVRGTIAEQRRSRKVMVIKYKAKSRYRRKHGHRQHETKVKIEVIGSVETAPKSKRATKEA